MVDETSCYLPDILVVISSYYRPHAWAFKNWLEPQQEKNVPALGGKGAFNFEELWENGYFLQEEGEYSYVPAVGGKVFVLIPCLTNQGLKCSFSFFF